MNFCCGIKFKNIKSKPGFGGLDPLVNPKNNVYFKPIRVKQNQKKFPKLYPAQFLPQQNQEKQNRVQH